MLNSAAHHRGREAECRTQRVPRQSLETSGSRGYLLAVRISVSGRGLCFAGFR